MQASATQRNHVQVLGRPDGPVVMFAHGYGCDQQMWQLLVPAFVDDHRVVLFDHVGAGRSDLAAYDPVRYSTLDGYAADLLQICDELDLHDVTLVGHSVSAMVAVVAAVQQPERFASLVLVAPSPRYISDPSVGYVGGLEPADVDELLESLDSNYFGWASAVAPMVMGADHPQLGQELTESFCRTDPDIARAFARVTFLCDARHLLPQVTTPALVLQCTDDFLAPEQVGRYVHDQLAGSTYVRLRATGHCPHVSAPQETATVIRAYLASRRTGQPTAPAAVPA